MATVEVFRMTAVTTCPSVDEQYERITVSANPEHYHGIGSLEIPDDLQWFTEDDIEPDGDILVATGTPGDWDFVSPEIESYFQAHCPGWLD